MVVITTAFELKNTTFTEVYELAQCIKLRRAHTTIVGDSYSINANRLNSYSCCMLATAYTTGIENIIGSKDGETS